MGRGNKLTIPELKAELARTESWKRQNDLKRAIKKLERKEMRERKRYSW